MRVICVIDARWRNTVPIMILCGNPNTFTEIMFRNMLEQALVGRADGFSGDLYV